MVKIVFRVVGLVLMLIVALALLLPLSALGLAPVSPRLVAGILCSLVGALMIGALVALLIARYFLRKFGKALQGMHGNTTPSDIRLRRSDAVVWNDSARVAATLDAMRGAGFESIGYYLVPQMPGLKLQAFIHHEENLFGVIYEHPQAGVWADLVAYHEDGGSTTLTNSPHGGTMDARPGHDKIADRHADPAVLLSRWRSLAERRAVEPLSAEEFTGRFEKAYADEMAWRAARGGPTRDEIRRVAAASGTAYDEGAIDAAREVLHAHSRDALRGMLLKEFARIEGWSDERVEAEQEWLAIVHDQTDPAYVAEWFEGAVEEGLMSEPQAREGERPREFFARLNRSLPPAWQYRKLRTLQTPAGADVYRRD